MNRPYAPQRLTSAPGSAPGSAPRPSKGPGWRRRGLLLGAVLLLVGTVASSAAQPWSSRADRLEPGVLAPQDEPDYGVAPAAERLEPGVLGRADELEPGLIGLDDPIFHQPSRFAQTPFESDRLEPGLIGLDDPLFR